MQIARVNRMWPFVPGTTLRHGVRYTLPDKVRLLAPQTGDSGPDSNDDRFEEALRYATLIAPKLTIQGGTREVLRGIIARGLGLR